MTQEEKKSNFRKLFAGVKIDGCSVVEDWEEIQVWPDYEQVQYVRLYVNFKDNKRKGIGFINSLTCDKLQACGLNPFDGKLDKCYMLSLLNSTGKVDIKLELPDNYEK